VHIGRESAKIIDVKFKIIRPTHKTIGIIHSLPNLTWALPKTVAPAMAWDMGRDAYKTAGFHVYRSFLKDRGYGRIEHKLLKEPHYEAEKNSSESLPQGFYRVRVVGINGLESGLSDEFLSFPEALASAEYFKNAVYISPNKDKRKLSKPNEYASLSDAMARSNSPQTVYIVKQRRQDIAKGENLSNDPRVFYEDDLRFLKGEVTISLFDGIDEDAEIEILVLCKLGPEEKDDLSLNLKGATGINLKKIGKIQPKIRDTDKKTDAVINKRYSLTPAEVNAYSANGIIYLVWQKPEGDDYRGVRIFRSEKRHWNDLNNPGKEVYQGIGFSKIIECTLLESQPIEIRDESNQITGNKALNFQPPAKPSELPAPKGFRMIKSSPLSIVGAKGELSFGDNKVSPNTIYTYTLIAFDRDHNYSYPVLLNTSIEGASENRRCMVKENNPTSKVKTSP
jgi:hypothetical protein